MSFLGTNSLPLNWDTVLLPCALQAIRCDPASAHGFAPAALMLGRPLYYPFEIKNCDIDLTGNIFNYVFFLSRSKKSLFSRRNNDQTSHRPFDPDSG